MFPYWGPALLRNKTPCESSCCLSLVVVLFSLRQHDVWTALSYCLLSDIPKMRLLPCVYEVLLKRIQKTLVS